MEIERGLRKPSRFGETQTKDVQLIISFIFYLRFSWEQAEVYFDFCRWRTNAEPIVIKFIDVVVNFSDSFINLLALKITNYGWRYPERNTNPYETRLAQHTQKNNVVVLMKLPKTRRGDERTQPLYSQKKWIPLTKKGLPFSFFTWRSRWQDCAGLANNWPGFEGQKRVEENRPGDQLPYLHHPSERERDIKLSGKSFATLQN